MTYEHLEELLNAYKDLARGYSQNAPGVITQAKMIILRLEKDAGQFHELRRERDSRLADIITDLQNFRNDLLK